MKLGGRVYFVDDGASLVIVDAKTGELIGKKKANGTVEQMKLGRVRRKERLAAAFKALNEKMIREDLGLSSGDSE